MRVAALSILLVLATTMGAVAQVQVDLAIKRSLYIRYEPVLATVSITNLSGRELRLEDDPRNHWFGFQVETTDGRPVPPTDPNYSNAALVLGAGQRISRTVNLTPLFPISEFGAYRVRATVYVADLRRFFSSQTQNIEITDGRVLWQKTVGVPDGQSGAGSLRAISILSHRLSQTTQLYIRIEDPDQGVIFCTHQLGRFLTFGSPDIMLDQQNRVHILQNAAPKVFLYSKIGLNGEVLDRKSYNEFSTRPTLRRGSDGSVVIVGGQIIDPNAPKPEETLPGLGDRPVALPEEGATPTPPPADEKRPENLLSR
ncbi:MAG: hypothetical protein SFU53_03910 [Terrimicrobiaceae bacterium]|nr:hypothetical protein [Terrimicrobiaceae bacterium]